MEKTKKLKILDYTHHVMHQMDMAWALKDDCDFYYLINSWRSWNDQRFKDARPIPENIKFVPYYEKGKYDVAILHVDQQAANPLINKARIFKEFDESITDIPKIVINHGTPVYPEYFNNFCTSQEHCEKTCRVWMKRLTHDLPMVVNSHDAASEKEWGWGIPIVHGMNPDFWYDLPKEPRIISSLSPAGLDFYYNREIMQETVGLMGDLKGIKIHWAKVNCRFPTFDEYRDFLGRSLIYLDVSYRTPMNRARTEAMLAGCCVVQVKGAHDLDRWAKDGENIILVENKPMAIIEKLADLVENRYDECVQIGQNAKKMAQKEFSVERYRQDWLNTFNKVIKNGK